MSVLVSADVKASSTDSTGSASTLSTKPVADNFNIATNGDISSHSDDSQESSENGNSETNKDAENNITDLSKNAVEEPNSLTPTDSEALKASEEQEVMIPTYDLSTGENITNVMESEILEKNHVVESNGPPSQE